MEIKSYIITGPTASGKSDFAHKLAQNINGTIINCDSVQIYSGIENISASPLVDDIGCVPYKLFSILPLSQQISVADYLELARREYDAAIAAGRVPIFVGGTGFYVNAIINGISPIPNVGDAARTRAREMVARDIVGARALLPADFKFEDPQRVARALEIFFETGRHLTEFQNMPRTHAIAPNAVKILINPPRDVLHKRIAARIPKMMTGGAVAEAQNIINNNLNETRAIGASQLCQFLRGQISESECFANWIIKTNQYAKRQQTWFRTQFNADIEIPNLPTDNDIKNV